MTVTKRENSPFFFSEFTLGKKKHIRSTKTKNKAQAIKIDQQYYLSAIEDQKLRHPSFLGLHFLQLQI